MQAAASQYVQPRDGNNGFAIGCSPAMRALERAVRDVAASSIPVLIVGEAGTGKRTLAHCIHSLSPSSDQCFREFACSTMGSDFFQAGMDDVFTGAGTLLLREITEVPPASQLKLLAALGEASDDQLRPRLLCSTRRNLEDEVRQGRLREDLSYRISGVCLRIPPLRHRREDIPALVDHFLDRYSALFGRVKPILSPATVRYLHEYAWPGNVRELEEAVKTLAAVSDERVAVAALRGAAADPRRRNGHGETVSLKDAARAASRQAERELILRVLSRTRWNRKRAAEELRISYKALLYKLKQIGLDDDGEAWPSRGEDHV